MWFFCTKCERDEMVILTYPFEGRERLELDCGHDFSRDELRMVC
ncbi:hypothetical protein SEA_CHARGERPOWER_82 [Mycobacterium phage Chargerpower]|nr:hypothetical protein SEA_CHARGERPOWER_82 [Mycobacterium phage Chargerpower]